MAVERDLELLDDYLSNRLSGPDKEAFERQLESDIELKNEFQTQQQLIEGIKSARASELKAMLNNVPVPPIAGPGELTLFTKVAASVVVAGLIGTGIYFFANRDNNEEITNEPIAQIQPEVIETEETEETKTSPKASNDSKAAVKESQPEKTLTRAEKRELRKAAKATKKASKDSASVNAGQEMVSEKKKLEVFDPTREAESTVKGKDKELTSEESVAEEGTSIQVTTDNTNKKYTFHYQWKNGNLMLYGSFEKNLYEILEFFSSDDKRTAFLYYKENYYLLNEDNEKVKELTPISDQTLLKKLKEYRDNK